MFPPIRLEKIYTCPTFAVSVRLAFTYSVEGTLLIQVEFRVLNAAKRDA